MKIKVEPNSRGVVTPFINHTKKEQGITLIALAVMIVILLLLTAVVIKGITGEEAILKVSQTATNEHNIIQYKEQVSALRDSIILKYEMTGQSLNLEKLAREMNQETTWIKRAVANLDKEETNEDIVVETVDGYVYQLYYSEEYGQRYIEYIGRADGEDFPTVIAKYEKETSNIVVIANAKKQETVSSIEIIHKGEIIESIKESNNLSKEIQKSGWYIVRVTAKDRKTKICMDKSRKHNSCTKHRNNGAWRRRTRK